MKASKDFEAVLQPLSLLDPEVEPEADALMATGDAGPGSSETEENLSSKTVKHHSLKCPASEPLKQSTGKGKAFKKPTGTLIEDAVAFLVISEKAITMTGISEGDLLIVKVTKSQARKVSRASTDVNTVAMSWSKRPKVLLMLEQSTWGIACNATFVVTVHSGQWISNLISL